MSFISILHCRRDRLRSTLRSLEIKGRFAQNRESASQRPRLLPKLQEIYLGGIQLLQRGEWQVFQKSIRSLSQSLKYSNGKEKLQALLEAEEQGVSIFTINRRLLQLKVQHQAVKFMHLICWDLLTLDGIFTAKILSDLAYRNLLFTSLLQSLAKASQEFVQNAGLLLQFLLQDPQQKAVLLSQFDFCDQLIKAGGSRLNEPVSNEVLVVLLINSIAEYKLDEVQKCLKLCSQLMKIESLGIKSKVCQVVVALQNRPDTHPLVANHFDMQAAISLAYLENQLLNYYPFRVISMMLFNQKDSVDLFILKHQEDLIKLLHKRLLSNDVLDRTEAAFAFSNMMANQVSHKLATSLEEAVEIAWNKSDWRIRKDIGIGLCNFCIAGESGTIHKALENSWIQKILKLLEIQELHSTLLVLFALLNLIQLGNQKQKAGVRHACDREQLALRLERLMLLEGEVSALAEQLANKLYKQFMSD